MRREGELLGGYRLVEALGRGSSGEVYRATKAGQSYAVKLFRGQISTLERTLGFRREAAALAKLTSAGAVGLVELSQHGQDVLLVMNLVEGPTLAERLEEGPMDEAQALRLMTQLAETLVEVHAQGMVHRDLNPSNIILGEGGDAVLIDFGLVAEEEQARRVGTLAYAPPEQLGLVERAIGPAADLYSLGATVFHAVSGTPPFVGQDSARLLHSVATESLPSLAELGANVRPNFERILSDLMSKDPEDRYQSAAGLLQDLVRLNEPVSEPWQGSLAVRSPLHEDVLQGREQELQVLRTFLDQGVGLQAVIGGAGAGKTSLVQEALRCGPADAPATLKSKCEQNELRPLSVTREALGGAAAHSSRIADALKEQLGELAVDDHVAVLGACPELASLGVASLEAASDAMAGERGRELRADTALVELIAGASAALGGLVWHVDDVQWLGSRDLEVLRQLSGRGNDGLRLVVTSREGDADLLQVAGKSAQPALELKPLDLDAAGALVSARLGAGTLDPAVLEALTLSTRGNPFALREYTRAIRDSGQLSFTDGVWRIPEDELARLNLPRDVVALVLRRLKGLDDDQLRILDGVEVLGAVARVPVLAGLLGKSEPRVRDGVSGIVELGLLVLEPNGRLRFRHDRVREAVAASLKGERRGELMLRAARLLQQDASLMERPQQSIAHFLEGAAAEGCDVPDAELAGVNRAAGLLALEQQSFGEAYRFLSLATDHYAALASGDGALPRAERAALMRAHGRACAMTGHLEEARGLLEAALPLTDERRESFELGYLLTLTLASEGENDAALESLYAAFADFGRPFPRWRIVQAAGLFWAGMLGVMWTLLRAVGLGNILRVTGEAAEERKVLSRLNYAGTMLAMFDGNTFLMVQFIVRDFLNVQRLCPCPEKAVATTVYGAVVGTFRLRRVMEYHCGAGVKMAEELGDSAALSVCRSYHACGTKWAGDLDRGTQLQLQALPLLGRHVPGSWYLAMMICEQAYSYHHQGRSRAAHQHVQEWLPALEQTNNRMFIYNTQAVDYAARRVLGDRRGAAQLWSKLEVDYQTLAKTGYAQLARVQASFEDFVDRRDSSPEVQRMIEDFADTLGEDYYSLYARSLYGYAHADLAESGEGERGEAGRKRLWRLRWATRMRALAPVHSVHPKLWGAILDRMAGRFGRARRKLRSVQRLTQGMHSPWASFRLALERARLAKAAGEDAVQVQAYAEEARGIAKDEGWTQKERWLAGEFSLARSDGSKHRTSSSPSAPERSAKALLQVSLASSTSLDPEQQAEQILESVVQVFGAERALFYLLDEDGETESLVLMASAGGGAAQGSQTVIDQVLASGEAVVLAGDEEGERLDSASIQSQGLRSIMAAPLRWQERTIGVLYLDNRLVRGIFSEGDVDLLLALGAHIAIAIQTRRAALVKAEQEALSRDLDLVAAVQNLLLPKTATIEKESLSLSSYYRPAQQCGGDWWWVDEDVPGLLEVWMGDVSGHGAAAAMVTSSVAGAFHSLRAAAPSMGIEDTLSHLHQSVRSLGGGFHMTMGVLRIHASGHLELWSAGSPPLFVGGTSPTVVQASGTPLGSLSDSFQVGKATHELPVGAEAMWCTDGLLELELPSGREVGHRGAMALLREAPPGEVVAAVETHFGALTSQDDITVLVARNGAR